MTKEMTLQGKDLLVMNLAHYFITEEDYNPILVHGIRDEIWLENMTSDYKIIRIVNHYIHNNEQLGYDKYKLNQIVKRLKVKTLSFRMNVINIYTNLGDNVDLNKDNDNCMDMFITKLADIKNENIIEIFPNIIEKTHHEEKGINLFLKITEDINKTTVKKNMEAEELFKKKIPTMTYIIMVICLAMFVLCFVSSGGTTSNKFIYTLLRYGANYSDLTINGEYYRLVTCMFLHAGIIHIACNMYSLYIIGPQIENLYGKKKFLFIYLVSGIAGSILSICFTKNTVSVGASGAIFGLLGAMLYFGYYYRAYLGNVLKSQIIPIIVINLVIGFTSTGIDNAAHIGGLIGGVLTAMALGVNDKSTRSDKVNAWIILAIYLAFIIYLGFFR